MDSVRMVQLIRVSSNIWNRSFRVGKPEKVQLWANLNMRLLASSLYGLKAICCIKKLCKVYFPP